jgi:tetratricopeptide (TPR) repeat protein
MLNYPPSSGVRVSPRSSSQPAADRPGRLLQKARYALHQKKPAKALDLVSEAAKSMPRLVEVLLVRAGALLDIGKAERALICIEAALDMDPTNGDIAVERCRVLLELGEFGVATRELEELAASYGRDPEVLHLLATSYEMTGNYEQAALLFVDAAQIDPASFPEPSRVQEKELRILAEQILSTLPPELDKRLGKVSVQIMPVPPPPLIDGQESPFPSTVLGVCLAPVSESFLNQNSLSEHVDVQVVLFQRNLERASIDRSDLENHVRVTIVNEISHHFGLHLKNDVLQPELGQ